MASFTLQDLVYTVQKRGNEFYIVRSSAFIGTREWGPFATINLADAQGAALATADNTTYETFA